MSRHPEVKWAQRTDKVYITVQLPDSKSAKVDLTPDGVFTFSASAGPENKLYEIKLDLFDKVNVEESKINIGMRSVVCILEKAEEKWWKKLLRGDEKVPHYVKVDWDKWVDEDEDTGPADLDNGGMDFSKFGDMGGMGGMPGMGGMGGMPGMGGIPGMEGLGGMPGMGGMGGFPGMGGMPGMGSMEGMGFDGEDFDDSDDEEITKSGEKDADDKEGEQAKPEGHHAKIVEETPEGKAETGSNT